MSTCGFMSLYGAMICPSIDDDFAYPAQCDQETRLIEYEHLLYPIKWMAIGANFERWHRQFGGKSYGCD